MKTRYGVKAGKLDFLMNLYINWMKSDNCHGNKWEENVENKLQNLYYIKYTTLIK